MAREFNWNLRLQGYILSSFPIGYLTSQIFAHMFVRRFGTKSVLALAVFTWSLVTFATPFLAPVPFFLICSRIALGFGEGLGEDHRVAMRRQEQCIFLSCSVTNNISHIQQLRAYGRTFEVVQLPDCTRIGRSNIRSCGTNSDDE